MINISEKCLQALKNDTIQHVEIEVEPLRGNPFMLTEADLLLNGFELENHSVCGEQLEIGSMTAAFLKLILDNEDSRFDNVFFAGANLRVRLIIPLDDGAVEYIPYGKYTVDEQPRAWSTITLEAFDNMVKLDIPFSVSSLPQLITVRELVQMGVEKAGLRCHDYSMFPDSMARGGLDVTKIKSESPITWRQVLMWCCQCAGVCGFADENGDVKFGFYKKYTPKPLQTKLGENLETKDGMLLLIDDAAEGDFPLPPSLRFINNMQLDESDCVLTGHQFKIDDALYPEDAVMDYGLQSDNNLVFYAAVRAKPHFANAANNAVAGLSYRPYSCDIISMPHLQLLDSVDYIKDGVHYHSIITNITFRLNGFMRIEAKAKSAVQKGWASLGALTPGQRAIIDSVSRKVDKTQLDLTAREQFLISFNEAITGSMGFYSTIKEQADGSRISYMHNKPNLEESQTIYTFGVNGFAWTNDGWNNGSPVWQSGFDKNGNAILNAIYAHKLTADVIVSGYLRSQNGASWIDMRYGTFCFGSDAGTALALDENKQLNVYGTIKNIKYPAYSVSIGASERGNFGALNATFDDANYGDIFQVHPTYWYNGDNQDDIVDRGMTITSPFVGTGKGNRQSVEFKSSEVMLWSEKNLGSVLLKGKDACVSVFRDNINISTSASHRHCWFNYFQPKYGYSPIAYDFGNGAGGHADVLCANVECGAVTSSGEVKCTSVNSSGDGIFNGFGQFKGGLTVIDGQIVGSSIYSGGEVWASGYNLTSDPNQKENIVEQTKVKALPKLLDMKFYSYNIKNSSVHIKYGTMAPEAPSEIQTEDGTGIELYSYICFTAKSVQELNSEYEAQAEKIKTLEARIDILEKLIADLKI